MRAAILAIGGELLAAEVRDKNGPYAAVELRNVGIEVTEISLLPDDEDVLVSSFERLAKHNDLILCFGGLGPTSDDKTTAAICRWANQDALLDEAQWQSIVDLFEKRGMPLAPSNKKQAEIPSGAQIFHNRLGTAAGYGLEYDGTFITALPGPPRENQPMFLTGLVPWLQQQGVEVAALHTEIIRTFGVAESVLANTLAPLEQKHADLEFAYQFHFPEVLVKLRFHGPQKNSSTIVEEVRRHIGRAAYATGTETLPTLLGRKLRQRNQRMVTAESCTAGLVSMLMTDTPGSTAWLDCGFATYSNAAKRELLGVPAATLSEHGAVSEPVALAMLQGALQNSKANVGIAITGISGPGGGSADKPVGTTWIAWGAEDSMRSRQYLFPWSRTQNRTAAAWTAMMKLWQWLETN